MILRDLHRAAASPHDLIVVGGGIHGATLTLEAARRGLKPLLLEARDFGGGASGSSLRIVHGGLRYLQSLDFTRFRQSVRERRWFAKQYPDLVRPLPCLMPLYGEGLKRSSVFRAALWVNDLLGADRNSGVESRLALPQGEVLGRNDTVIRFPLVRRQSLQGGALWYDYFMRSSERILIETLREACALGAQAANYAPVERLAVSAGQVEGVILRDAETGATFEVSGRRVVNCTGQRCNEFAASQGGAVDGLFHPSIAFNLLLDVVPPADCAVAVSAPRKGAPVYFLVPQGRKLLAGTVHRPRPAGTLEAVPSPQEIEEFLTDLRAAIPGWEVRSGDVVRIFAGLLPARAAGSAELTTREVVVDHAKLGGPRGFFSVAGIKFTTARAVAERTLRAVFGELAETTGRVACGHGRGETPPLLLNAALLDAGEPARVRATLERIVAEEAVRQVDDLILRRTNWSTSCTDLGRLRRRIESLSLLPGTPAASAAVSSA